MKKTHRSSFRVLSLLAVLVVLILLLGALQAILVPKYRTDVLEGALIGEY